MTSRNESKKLKIRLVLKSTITSMSPLFYPSIVGILPQLENDHQKSCVNIVTVHSVSF